MPRSHTVGRGESLTTIARRYGFYDWHTVYDYQNSQFKQDHPNPNLIIIGDQLTIPDPVVKSVSVPTGKKHKFQVTKTAQKVQFRIDITDQLNPSDPVPGITASLVIPSGATGDLVTDNGGSILMEEPDISAGKVDVTALRDTTEAALIRYDSYAKKGLSTNQIHKFQIPDKRKIIKRILSAQGIVRRLSWDASIPPYAKMAENWDYGIVVIHHSGNGGEKDPKKILRKHLAKGYDDVGYHYLIVPSGQIYEGCYLAYKGTHVKNANTGKVGILVMGDFEPNWWDSDDIPTEAQLDAVVALVKTLKSELKTITKLGGHRDYAIVEPTECPGQTLYDKLGALRKATGLGGP